jgi:hypothetical protein
VARANVFSVNAGIATVLFINTANIIFVIQWQHSLQSFCVKANFFICERMHCILLASESSDKYFFLLVHPSFHAQHHTSFHSKVAMAITFT